MICLTKIPNLKKINGFFFCFFFVFRGGGGGGGGEGGLSFIDKDSKSDFFRGGDSVG